jgi:glycine/D-amino acid oxidase-like deaminating enzyme
MEYCVKYQPIFNLYVWDCVSDGVAVIDHHTDLRPFGYGEPIRGHKPGESGQQRHRDCCAESLGAPLKMVGSQRAVKRSSRRGKIWQPEQATKTEHLTMLPETFSKSLWSALSPPGLELPELGDDAQCDVLVIGAGLLGLSTALHLAESGVKVTLVEADEVGFGASGRNTGFVVPSLRIALGPEDVCSKLGANHGKRLNNLVGNSGSTVFDLVRRLGIECHAEQSGWLQPAHSANMAELLSLRCKEWRQRGKPLEYLSAEQTRARTGIDEYHGALLVPSGGQINPLAYARGLARASVERGVEIYEHTRVTSFAQRGGRWIARTRKASVAAERVLLTTNALIGRLVPEVAASIIPARVFQISTQTFDERTQQQILPTRSPIADTRRHTFAVRWSPDGRLITGGLVMPGPGRLERAKRVFAERLARFVPLKTTLETPYVWTGVVAATLDSLPRFMSIAPGMDAAIGCNGRGVALTTSLGKEIATFYSRGMASTEFVLPHDRPKPVPMRWLAELGPHVWLPWSEFRDRMEASSRRK